MDIRKQIEDIKDNVTLFDNNTYYLQETEVEEKIKTQVEKAYFETLGIEPSEEELSLLTLEILKRELKKRGCNDTELKEMSLVSEIAIKEKVLEHEIEKINKQKEV